MAIGPPLADTQLVLDNDLFTHWRNKHPYIVEQISEYATRLKQIPALTSTTMFESLWGVEKAFVRKEISAEELLRYRSRIDQLSESSTVLTFNGTAAAIAVWFCSLISKPKEQAVA